MDNFLLSLTTQDPQNKLIARKCVQKIIKKPLSINNLFKESKLKYKLKLFMKLYSEIKK